MIELKPRQRAILAAVVEKYVQSAEPVGSGAVSSDPLLAAKFGALSPATVRNELAELENLGFLQQPHTSAGRVPTDLGYRYYVNLLSRPRELSFVEETQLEAVAPPASSVEDALEDAMVILAKMTGYPAVANLPGAKRDTMRLLQLNPIAPRRLILVLMTSSGRIEHRVFEVDDDVSPTRLQTVVTFLNENLGGKTLAKTKSADFETVSKGLHDQTVIGLARRAWEMVQGSIAEIADEKIVVQGLITLLDEPEFSQIGQARAALRLLEDQSAMGGLLKASSLDAMGQMVRIGREMPNLEHPNAQIFSFVGVSYGVGNEVLGTLGVLGPARMRYNDALSIVPALAARLQITLESF